MKETRKSALGMSHSPCNLIDSAQKKKRDYANLLQNVDIQLEVEIRDKEMMGKTIFGNGIGRGNLGQVNLGQGNPGRVNSGQVDSGRGNL